MAVEIERKFLVKSEQWRVKAKGTMYRQGYLCSEKNRTVRVRIAGDAAWVTVKGKSNGLSRLEFEYTVPVTDAAEMLDQLCPKPIIEKTRFLVEYQGFTWEIDEFSGDNAGLVVAEVELTHEAQSFALPPWAGKEVTGLVRYYNSHLATYPFVNWTKEEKLVP